MEKKESNGEQDDITEKIDALCAQENTLDGLRTGLRELLHGKQTGRSQSERRDVEANELSLSAQPKSMKAFSEVAKTVHTTLAVSSHIDRLKHEKPQPKDLSTQYDQKLKQLYLTEWPDAVPQHNREQVHCCCWQSCCCCCCCQPCYSCNDPERVKNTRELFKRVFPSFIFYFLVFTAAMPAGSKKCNILLNIFWYLMAAFSVLWILTPLTGIGLFADCFIMQANCLPLFKIGFMPFFGAFFWTVSTLITTLLVPTYLRSRLQSRELQTLISTIGPGRVGCPTYCWIIVFVVYIIAALGTFVSQVLGTFFILKQPLLVVSVPFSIAVTAPQFACLVFFLLVYRSTSLSYDDWTTKIISVTTAHPLRDATEVSSLIATSPETHSIADRNAPRVLRTETHFLVHLQSQARLIQNNFLKNLKARVSSSALVTRHAIWLFVSPLIALLGIVFQVVTLVIHQGLILMQVHNLVTLLLTSGVIQLLLLLIPMFMSARVEILENVVASASLRKISHYLEHAPTGWMMTQKTRLSISLLVTLIGASSGLLIFSQIFIESQLQLFRVPWDSQYDPFGSCSDGIRSGLEQHIDCGGPVSSCQQTCREKYGEYILIPATRDCTDVDGYVHITTQRACSTAYKSWSRQNNGKVVHHAKVFEGIVEFEPKHDVFVPSGNIWQHADWTNGFRCGATTNLNLVAGFENISFAAFPALFSSWEHSFGSQKPLAYLCYAERPQSCQAQASVHFDEPMACLGPVQHKWFASAWRNISGPRPIPSTNWRQSVSVAEFRAGRDNDGDCAEIRLHAHGIGSQVVFALECNVSAYVDTNTSASGGLSGHNGPGIACPEGDRVRLTVKSTAVPRGALVVYPEANSTSETRYTFESKQQTVLVSPGSTLIVVMDQSSNSMNIRLCF